MRTALRILEISLASAATLGAGAVTTAAGSAPARGDDGAGGGATIRSPGFLLDNGRYKTIEAPGARTHTYGHGITNRGQIAGGFDDPSVDGPDGRVHGSIRSKGGRFRGFDIPGAVGTVANKINDRGQIVGSTLSDSVGTESHGFVLRRGIDGPFTRIDFPGTPQTARGIDDHGRIVGLYGNPDAAPASARARAQRAVPMPMLPMGLGG